MATCLAFSGPCDIRVNGRNTLAALPRCNSFWVIHNLRAVEHQVVYHFWGLGRHVATQVRVFLSSNIRIPSRLPIAVHCPLPVPQYRYTSSIFPHLVQRQTKSSWSRSKKSLPPCK